MDDIHSQIEKIMAEHYQKNRKRLLYYISRRMGFDEEPEDILHDVYLNVFRTAKIRKELPSNINSLIFASVRNRLVDYYRSKRRNLESFSEMNAFINNEESENSNFEELISDSSLRPDIIWEREEIMDEIFSILKTLPREQSEMFERNEFGGIGFREMSEASGVNMNTLLARKRYAVLALRKELREKFGGDYEFMKKK